MKHDNILRFFGVLKNLDWNEKEKIMEYFKASFNKRIKVNLNKKFKAL